MAKYHLSADGNPRVCTAADGNCPLGADVTHFHSKVAARAAYEASLDSELIAPSVTKKLPKGITLVPEREKEELETVIPEKEYDAVEDFKPLSSLKPGNKVFDSNGDLVEVVSNKAGTKNATLITKNAAGKESKIYRPKDELIRAVVKVETEESKARGIDAYVESNLERGLKRYEPKRAKAMAELQLSIQKGYALTDWDYRSLIAADAEDHVMTDYERTVDSVKNRIAEGAEDFKDEKRPYNRAFQILKEEYTKEIMSQAARGESNSTSAIANESKRELLKAKADFLDNIRWW